MFAETSKCDCSCRQKGTRAKPLTVVGLAVYILRTFRFLRESGVVGLAAVLSWAMHSPFVSWPRRVQKQWRRAHAHDPIPSKKKKKHDPVCRSVSNKLSEEIEH